MKLATFFQKCFRFVTFLENVTMKETIQCVLKHALYRYVQFTPNEKKWFQFHKLYRLSTHCIVTFSLHPMIEMFPVT